jgi:formylglycine-generating enzyme required for sulfatase activity
VNVFQRIVSAAVALNPVCLLIPAFVCHAFGQDAAKATNASSPLRQVIARHEQTIRLDVKGERFELARIPPGEFLLGSPEAESGRDPEERHLRAIKITKPFYLGRYEVTRRQFSIVMDQDAGEANNGLPVTSRTLGVCTTCTETPWSFALISSRIITKSLLLIPWGTSLIQNRCGMSRLGRESGSPAS